MPKRDPAYMAAQRRRILEAALQCFAEHGVHGTSTDRIAEVAGCGKSVIYAHFKSKTQIAQAIAREDMRKLEDHELRNVDDLTSFLVDRYKDLDSPEIQVKTRLAMRLTVDSLNDPRLRDWMASSFEQTVDFMQGAIRKDRSSARWTAREIRDTARQLAFFWTGQSIYRILYPALPLRSLKQDMQQVIAALSAQRGSGKRAERSRKRRGAKQG